MKKQAFRTLLAASVLALLAACGGGGADGAGKSVFDPSNSTAVDTSTTTTQALLLRVSLLDGAGNATTSLVGSTTLRAQAVLTKGGVPQAEQLVKYSLDQGGDYAKLDNLSTLTDSNGIAVVTISPGSVAGAGQVKVLATLIDGTEVEGAANFVASPTSTPASSTLTLTNFIADSTQVSAYGTTGISVNVLENGGTPSQAVTVTFSSNCAVGKASITSSALTNASGLAVGTFEDIGCAGASNKTVILTAAISTNSAQRQITVLPSTVGSLRFVSVNPSDASITLAGNGGNGRQENAQLTFQLVDQAGNGVSDTEVCFDSTTYVGGLTLDGFNDKKLPTTQGGAILCGTDNIAKIRYTKRTDSSGNVSVQINSGTVPTPVRVRARAIYPTSATTPLETFSDSLSISTGLPIQRSMSLSVDKANIDVGNSTAGGQFDGDIATLTVRLADQFSNPVPDGTKVTFVASGGAVCTSQNGSCETSNGVCSCDMVGQNKRPSDGRVVVLAYADGLEDYVDSNGDNQYTSGEVFTDLPDAFVDANKSEAYSGVNINGDTDTPIPYQATPNYISGDGVRGNAHIRASTVIYFSAPSGLGKPTAVISNSGLSVTQNLLEANTVSERFLRLDPLGGCFDTVPQASLDMALDDGYGNPMAAGTTLTLTDFTDNLASKSMRPASVLALGARKPSNAIDGAANNNGGNIIKVLPWLPTDARGNVVTSHGITVQGVKEKCAGSARFVLDVKSPKGAAQLATVLYEGEPRTTVRSAFDARFLDKLVLSLDKSSVSLTDISLGTVSIDQADFNRFFDDSVQSYSIDWGDGTISNGTTLPLSVTSHQYTTTGSKVVKLTVVGLINTYTDTASVTVAP